MKGIIYHALSGRLPLELDYRDPAMPNDNGGNRKECAGAESVQQSDAKAQIAEAFAWFSRCGNDLSRRRVFPQPVVGVPGVNSRC